VGFQPEPNDLSCAARGVFASRRPLRTLLHAHHGKAPNVSTQPGDVFLAIKLHVSFESSDRVLAGLWLDPLWHRRPIAAQIHNGGCWRVGAVVACGCRGADPAIDSYVIDSADESDVEGWLMFPVRPDI
jgi:hypothetical protein